MFDADRIARMLLDARTRDSRAPDPGASAPTSLAQAYAVQDALIEQTGEPLGWKISHSRPGSAHLFEAAPILAGSVVRSPAKFSLLPDTVVECEIALIVGCDIAWCDNLTRQDVVDSIAFCHVAAEILAPRWPAGFSTPPLLLLADCASNRGVVLGEQFDRDRLPEIVRQGGRVAYLSRDEPPKVFRDDPIAMMESLLEALHQRQLGLTKGQIVITGAIDYARASADLFFLELDTALRAEVQFVAV